MGIINVNVTPSNVDLLKNKVTIAETDIDERVGGVVRIFGELWFCRPIDVSVIEEGKRVRVVKIEGVTLYVKEEKHGS